MEEFCTVVIASLPQQFHFRDCEQAEQHADAGARPRVVTTVAGSRNIQGVRVCQNEECRLTQTHDRTNASNSGLQFRRPYEGKSPIREMTDEEVVFNRLNVALHACSECD